MFTYLNHHPIDSLYTIESVIETVPVIEHILGQKLPDSGKYFACFLVIRFLSVQYFSADHIDTLSCVILLSTNRKRCSKEHTEGIRFG